MQDKTKPSSSPSELMLYFCPLLCYTKRITEKAVWNPMDASKIIRLTEEEQAILNMGTASLPMLDALGIEKIKVRFLPAEMMFSHYIAGTKVDLDEVNL